MEKSMKLSKITGMKGRIKGKKGFEVVGDIPTWLITALILIIFFIMFKFSSCTGQGVKPTSNSLTMQFQNNEAKLSYETLNFLRQQVEVNGRTIPRAELIALGMEKDEYKDAMENELKVFETNYGSCYSLTIEKGGKKLEFGTAKKAEIGAIAAESIANAGAGAGGLSLAPQSYEAMEAIDKDSPSSVFYMPALDNSQVKFGLYISGMFFSPTESSNCRVGVP